MIHSRTYASCFVLGMLATAFTSVTTFAANAEDYVVANSALPVPVNRIADHCAQFGQGFVDVGNGVCGRVAGHVRVYVGTSAAVMNPYAWPAGGTTSATLRSAGMVPGAEATHLRVRGGLESFNPFH